MFPEDIKYIIRHSEENYISFHLRIIRFLDSYRLLATSIDNMGKTLSDDIKLSTIVKTLKEIFSNLIILENI